MSADAVSTVDDADAPLAATDRIAALDVLRGFALLGIFIMNMPGFSHSIFAPPATLGELDALVAGLREFLFAGKFNLLFGLAFGIGFALQMARLDAAESARAARLGVSPRPHRATRVYARRLAFLFALGLVHAMLLWSGDVLLVYALIGAALLGVRRLGDRALIALVAACLIFPAASELARSSLFAGGFDTVATFQYQQFQASNDIAYGRGTFLDAIRETARIFDWSWRSPFGLFVYASFFVQMATGILAGFLLGRRGWPREPIAAAHADAERRALAAALVLAIAGSILEPVAGAAIGGDAGLFAATLARTIARAALAACYALAVVRIVRERPELSVPLRALRNAGRMPLTNYLLQTALASFVFYGWGLRLWNTTGPAAEVALAVALFVFVQLPFSSAWLARRRHGPLEVLWRRFTYSSPPP